jgi:hypothetical protein
VKFRWKRIQKRLQKRSPTCSHFADSENLFSKMSCARQSAKTKKCGSLSSFCQTEARAWLEPAGSKQYSYRILAAAQTVLAFLLQNLGALFCRLVNEKPHFGAR